MSIFQGLLFLLLGAGLLRVDYRALRSGSLPCGPNGFKGRLGRRFECAPQTIGTALFQASGFHVPRGQMATCRRYAMKPRSRG